MMHTSIFLGKEYEEMKALGQHVTLAGRIGLGVDRLNNVIDQSSDGSRFHFPPLQQQ